MSISNFPNGLISEIYEELYSKGLVSHMNVIYNKKPVAIKLIRSSEFIPNDNEFKNWITVWHGTQYRYLSYIIKDGLKTSPISKGIIVTPSIFYASNALFSQTIKSNEQYWYTIIEAKIKPNCFTKSSTCLKYKTKKGEPSEVEYCVQDENNVIVTSITFVSRDFIDNTEEYKEGNIIY